MLSMLLTVNIGAPQPLVGPSAHAPVDDEDEEAIEMEPIGHVFFAGGLAELQFDLQVDEIDVGCAEVTR